jgi:hypothetical protein
MSQEKYNGMDVHQATITLKTPSVACSGLMRAIARGC